MTLDNTTNTSETSTPDSPKDETENGFIELARLLSDLDDPEFHTLPEGEWEAKNNRDENGFPLK